MRKAAMTITGLALVITVAFVAGRQCGRNAYRLPRNSRPPPENCKAQLHRIFHFGFPTKDREAGWIGHIEFASWVDDEHIVYASQAGDITCLSLEDRQVVWEISSTGQVQDWSVSRERQRLAYLTDANAIVVVDCTSGAKLAHIKRDDLGQLINDELAYPTKVALLPDGRLIVVKFSQSYGRNAFVIDAEYRRAISSFQIDATPCQISIGPNGNRIATIADEHVRCVVDATNYQEVFFSGARILEPPETMTGIIDAPFFSHIRANKDQIVTTLDNSWGTGDVTVLDIEWGTASTFDAGNGHIEMDVLFAKQRIALTGTSTDLTVVDFDGNVIAHTQHATLQRNADIEFSPSEDRILVASWDNTISVYEIIEEVNTP